MTIVFYEGSYEQMERLLQFQYLHPLYFGRAPHSTVGVVLIRYKSSPNPPNSIVGIDGIRAFS